MFKFQFVPLALMAAFLIILAPALKADAMRWQSVAPRGAKICSIDEAFNYHPQDEFGKAAGVRAKLAFCSVIQSTQR